jgi:cytochrome b561
MGSYNSVAKWFHWITVVLMAVALPIGPIISHIKDESKMVFYAIHESAGLTLLIVVLARLAWRLMHPPPPLPDSVPLPLRRTAAFVHHALYALLILQPIMGFIATNAWGFPMRGKTAYLGLIDLPKIMDTNEALAGTIQTIHAYTGYTILALLVMHIGGVVFHQAIRRDGTLLRMV